MYLILRSSPIHPLILLTYSPNPVIPRSFSTRPFIHLSPNPIISHLHSLPLCPPLQSTPISAHLPPFPPHTSNRLSFLSSIPLDPVLARLSRCLNAWHQGFFSAEFSPSRMKMQCKELHSHLCKLSTSLTIQLFGKRAQAKRKKAQCSVIQISGTSGRSLSLSQFSDTSVCVMKTAAAERW